MRSAGDRAPPFPMILAHITDPHVRPRGRLAYGVVDTEAALARAVDAVRALVPQPDCVVVTGDLTDCGLPEEYEIVGDCLARLAMPVFVIPGNHDRRENLAAALRRSHAYLPAAGFQHYVVEDFLVRLIALDTVIPGEGGGLICAEREGWLADRLAEGDGRPTLLLMHHPPFLTGVTGMDELICRTSPEFAALIRRHPEIERILCGHYHRPIQVRWAGTVGFVAPSTAHQVALDLRSGEPNRFVLEPPGFGLHTWRPETGLVSHTQLIGDFGPPIDVVLDADYPGLADGA
jgi:3',5'-cyclic-AMP phosphodiesterase